ncbi:MAG: hypothetical protein IPK08_15610 [Bacteroidetes bacterium]|nr:hypothetical protein [Bacteroidota bacterium]
MTILDPALGENVILAIDFWSLPGKQLVLIEEVKRILVKIADLTPGYLWEL